MNMVIILEILVGIIVLAAAVRFAVRDARQRRGDGEQQDPSEAVAQREGEEIAALSTPSAAPATAPEPPADTR